MENIWTPGTSEFIQRALSGQISGVRRIVFAGFNAAVDIASTPEDIWGGDGLIPAPSSAESWEVVSSSADDSAAGIGARTLLIRTLDADFRQVLQSITMNGVTPVALTGTHVRINEAFVNTAGSNFVNVGTLTFRVAGAGATRGLITSRGSLNQAKYTCPEDHHIDLLSVVLSIQAKSATESAAIAGATITPTGRTLTSVRFNLFTGGTSLYRHEVANGTVPFFTLTERGEISFRAMAVSANNTSLEAAVLGLLYDNSVVLYPPV